MKSILQSIKPQYCELIANGKKTIEVRKTRPKLDVPFKVYIYCTKDKEIFYQSRYTKKFTVYKPKFYKDTEILLRQNGHTVFNGKVIGEYVCDEITGGYLIEPFGDFIQKQTCLTYEELNKYGNGKPLYLWHISDLVIYDEPKELSEFAKCNMPSFDDLDGSEVLCDYCTMTDFGERKSFGFAASDYYDCGGEECREAYKGYIEDKQYLTRPPQSWCYVEEV